MTGEVLHFVGIPGLKDYVFVSPTWLIDVIKCVISPAFQNTLDTAPSSDSRYESSFITSILEVPCVSDSLTRILSVHKHYVTNTTTGIIKL